MWKFIIYELRYWFKRPMIWIFLGIITFFSVLVFGSLGVTIGGAVGSLHKNSPYVVEAIYAVFSIVLLLMVTAFMNATAIRDFQYNMYQFVFSSPIKKRDYFFGKFIGASIISLIPMLGISLGALLAPIIAPVLPEDWNMAPAERFGEVIWSGHINGILVFALPNIIIAGVLLYTLALKFRSSIVSFISVALLIVFSSIAAGFASDLKKEWMASLLDPFGNNAFEITTRYTTVLEKNTTSAGFTGDIMINRLVWLLLAFVALLLVYIPSRLILKKKMQKKRRNKKTRLSL